MSGIKPLFGGRPWYRILAAISGAIGLLGLLTFCGGDGKKKNEPKAPGTTQIPETWSGETDWDESPWIIDEE